MSFIGDDLHTAREVRTRLTPEGTPLSIQLVKLFHVTETIATNIMRRRMQRNQTLQNEEKLPTFLCTHPDQLRLTKTFPSDRYFIPACFLTHEEIECLYMVYDQIEISEGVILNMSAPYTVKGIDFLNGIYNSQYFTWANTNVETFIPIPHRILYQLRNCFIVPPTPEKK